MLSKLKSDHGFTGLNLLLVAAPFVSINFLSQVIGLYVAVSFFIFMKNVKWLVFEVKKSYVEFLYFFLPLLILSISLLWTENLARGADQIFKRVPLILLPFSFFIQRFFWGGNLKNSILKFYVVCCTLFSLYGFLSIFIFYPIDYKTHLTFIHLRYLLEQEVLHIHPVYLGLFCGLASVIAFYYGFQYLKVKLQISLLFFIAFAINVFTMFFISARMPIFGTVVGVSTLLFWNKHYKTLGLIAVLFIGSILTVQYVFPGNRFNEIFETLRKASITTLNEKNTINLRYTIYNCGISLFRAHPIIGYGIGDIQGKMFQCTEDRLGTFKFNSHNQYLEFMISTGVIGLIAFVTFLSFLVKRFFATANLLGTLILLFFIVHFLTENLLARTRGVFIFSFMIYFIYFFYDSNQRTKNHSQL